MASSRDRERKLARAKVERRQAALAAKIGTQRQTRARVLAAVVVLAVVAVIGAVTNWFGTASPAAAAQCEWKPSTLNVKYQKDVGTPPSNGNPISGTRPVEITTNEGTLSGTLNVSLAQCTAASWTFLAGKHFFDGTSCSRLTTGPDLYMLQCGDPFSDKNNYGGPTYTIADENLPEPISATATAAAATGPGANLATYPAGTIAMANSGQANTAGSQFFLVYKDSTLPDTYSVVGTLDDASTALVAKIASGGVAAGGASTTDGPPATGTTISSLTVGALVQPLAPSPSVAPTPTGSSTPSSSPSPSASASSPSA